MVFCPRQMIAYWSAMADMEAETRANDLRAAGRRALEVQDELLSAWKRLDPDDLRLLGSPEDLDLLQELILRRIYPVNAFAALVKVSRHAAVDMLFSRYLGHPVDPDTKFGGYAFELSAMLDDLREAHGEAALRDLIGDPRFHRHLLNDDRVVSAFADALDTDVEHFCEWTRGESLVIGH
jgi:hypothetical protein